MGVMWLAVRSSLSPQMEHQGVLRLRVVLGVDVERRIRERLSCCSARSSCLAKVAVAFPTNRDAARRTR
jgi:hypothetical protein